MCRVLGLRVGRATGDPQQMQVDAAAGRGHAPRTQRGVAGDRFGGEQFNVDDNGHIEVPDDGDYHGLLAPHGFTPAPQAKKSKAELAAEREAAQREEQARTQLAAIKAALT